MATRIKLGELLVRAGVLDEFKLKAALAEQQRWGGRLGKILVEMNFVSEDLLVKALSKQLGVPRARLDIASVPGDILAKIDVPFAVANAFCPERYVADKKTLVIAMADPTNVSAVDELRFKTGLRIETSLAGEFEITQAIERIFYGRQPIEGIDLAGQQGGRPPPTTSPFGSTSSFSQRGGFGGYEEYGDEPRRSEPGRAPAVEPRGFEADPGEGSRSGIGAAMGLGLTSPFAAAPAASPFSQLGAPPATPFGTVSGSQSAFGTSAGASGAGAPMPPTLNQLLAQSSPFGAQGGLPSAGTQPTQGVGTLIPGARPQGTPIGAVPSMMPPPAPPPAALPQAGARPALETALEMAMALDGAQKKQLKALRVMLELLIEKGVFSREEYMDLVNRR